MNITTMIGFGILLAPQFYVYPFLDVSSEFALKFGFRALTIFAILTDIFLFGKSISLSHRRISIYALYATLIFAIASISYSADPALSGVRTADLISFILMAVYFSSKLRSTQELANFVECVIYIYLGGFLLLTYLSGEPIWRPMGFEGVERLGGFIVNPNIFAYALLLLFSAQLFAIRRRSIWLTIPLFSVEIVAFYFCFSRSATFAVFIGLLLFARARSIAAQGVFLLMKFLFLAYIVFSISDIMTYLERGHGIENVTSLGGRTDVWAMIIAQADFGVNIIWGFGYQMLSSNGLTASDDTLTITMAHSNLVQALLGLGLVGLLLFVLFWFDTLRNAFKRSGRSRETQNFLKLSALFVFIYSMVEYGIFGPPTIIAPLFLTILFFSSRSAVLKDISPL